MYRIPQKSKGTYGGTRASAVSLSLAFALGVHYRGDHRVSQLVGGLQTCLLYARFAVDPEADLFPPTGHTQRAAESTAPKKCMQPAARRLLRNYFK